MVQEEMNFLAFKRTWEEMDEFQKAQVRDYVAIFMDFRLTLERDFHESDRKLGNAIEMRDLCEKSGISESFLTTLSTKLANSLLSGNANEFFEFITETILNNTKDEVK